MSNYHADVEVETVRAELGAAFRAAWSRYKQETGERSGEFGLSSLQARALRALDRPLTMSQLASALRAEPSNLTPIVDRLEAAGLVERRVVPGDRRVRELCLTEEGKGVRERLLDNLFGGPSLFDRLSAEEQQTLLRLLTKLADPD